MIKETISNSNFWLGLCVAGLAFIMLYPTIEYNFNCPNAAAEPDGNETCINIKGMLWVAVGRSSLRPGREGYERAHCDDEYRAGPLVH